MLKTHLLFRRKPMANLKSLVGMQEDSCKRYATRPIFGTKGPDGYEWITYSQFGRLVDEMRGGLASLGVVENDKVAIISKNSTKWAVAAYATYGRKGQFVSMYEEQAFKEWKFIIENSKSKVLLAANSEIFEATKDLPNEIETLEHVIDLSGSESDPKTFRGLLKTGRSNPVPSEKPEPDDPMGLIYTSGTTGNPKGVVLSHDNILSNCNAIFDMFDITEEDRTLSILPWAHVFGQTIEVHGLIRVGFSTGFVENPTTVVQNLSEIRPTIFVAVPRLFNKIYEGVSTKIKEEGGLAEFLYERGMEYAQKKKSKKSLGIVESLVYHLANKLVFTKIRGRFGGNLRYCISGAAALNVKIGEFVDNLGITIYEGYGLSETSPIVSANTPLGGKKLGSVGKVLPGVKILLDKTALGENSEDGEIIVFGPNVMLGYYDLPDETAVVMTEEGGFRTGDIGRLDRDGFLSITGRIKEQYKLENGKYVVPSPIEEQLQLSTYINQALIYGDNRLYNVALLIPNLEQLKKFAIEQGISDTTETLLNHPKVLELYRQELDHYSKSLKGYEIPKKFALNLEEWTAQNGMMTPSYKLKRRVIVQKNKSLLDSLYD
jgi:long-chain acyl-CoA synthetase